MTGKKDAEKVAGGATDAAVQQICTKFGKFAQLVGGFSCLQANDDRLVVVEQQQQKNPSRTGPGDMNDMKQQP